MLACEITGYEKHTYACTEIQMIFKRIVKFLKYFILLIQDTKQNIDAPNMQIKCHYELTI